MINSIKLILVGFISFVTSLLPSTQTSFPVKSVSPIPPVVSLTADFKTNENKNPVSLEVNGDKFSAYYFEVKDVKKLEFYPNFTQKQTAAEIINQRKCSALFNGSFYSKNSEPIGLFVSQSKKINSASFNSLLNGFLFRDSDDSVSIGDSPPVTNPPWALQSGPLLFKDGQSLHLRINNDETARRVVAALNNLNQLIFIALYDPENNLQGPYLAYLPQYLSEFSLTSGIKIKDAINLDGGGASAFYAHNFFLPEFNFIGSYFCSK